MSAFYSLIQTHIVHDQLEQQWLATQLATVLLYGGGAPALPAP